MSFKPFLAYSASAGSGKTFALSVRYISLLFMGESPRAILAATFTNKAAAEMRQRVVDALRHLGSNEAFLEAVMVQTGFSRAKLFEKQPEVLRLFLSQSAYIVTLDSFFVSILRSSSLEIGLEPDFVTKEQGVDALEAYFLEEVQANGLLSSLVTLAMEIEDKRFGKIFDLMQDFYRLDPLLPEPKKPELSPSVQEEVCEELRLKLFDALERAGATPRCLKQFSPQPVKTLFIKKLFEKETLGEHTWFKKVANDEIEGLYAYLKEALATWAQAKESVVLHHLFALYGYYRNATISMVKHTGVLTFDDLAYFTYRLLHESISKSFLYFKIDSKFNHILLDEFQDTSTLQFLLLKPLIDEIFAGEGQHTFKSFFYVGDTKQSLYRFRGGVEELFDKVAERYGIEIEQMDTNYRSAKHIVSQVNRWFEPVMKGYVPQKSPEGVSEGYVAVLESEDPIEEAVSQVQALLAHGIALDDIAFLVHTNKEGQNLQEACHKEGIATLLKTASSLKNMPKIAALVAMVSYLFYGEKIDAHAMLLHVGKPLETIETSWFSLFMSPLQVVDRLIREFGYFENDLNLLKLLEFASQYRDIPTFLEEFESSRIAIASNSVHGAKIMTIHGSKGLEFHYVIVLDKISKKRADTSPLLFHYNAQLSVEEIRYRMQHREYFDRDYAEIKSHRKVSMEKDSLNVLYVALTRGVEGMIVIRKPKDSLFDLLGLSPLTLGSIATQTYVEEEPSGTLPSLSSQWRHYGTQETPEREEEEEKDYEAILFGTALHYGLEMLGSFTLEALPLAMMAVQNRYGNALSSQQLEEIAHRMRMLLDTPAFLALLEGATIRKEQSFAFEGALKQIDLLLEYETHHLIVEYKSSKKYAIKHQNQVGYYRKAIQKITGKESRGVVVYLLEDGIELLNLN